ncbi:NRAMP family divalent metal transporter [Mucilaginibacter lappiensis]|uniref:NRAMP (Natural resistance-associated macrophage protein)-like metal ion transporter n=1 Tax=Mucilaginibacter lappiensis TaxID=354630 RepID=A0A1N7ALG9_9SPHI|nr:divalent metal cation transporter [Mucilaginibacter lappiensis]MBB6110516.1 NRAMP (natural resistance-associated macrophage protein)-like metal ion transporter [Mucilaginibacter lappiensis]MBB6131812.1 NRAMP (natural resistance-associated macrophage protein)-like metal ion transporter [Mucilaginibacter lappiensis]SIR39878.1 NRAMP (natural resistance-associated macrophage protein) metal ion transporters [Mucilaginibacter lappiensis]
MKEPTKPQPGYSKKKLWKFLTVLGPGLTTGAADDDPSGIATYSQTGAQFGYGQLWTALFMLPFMTAVQEACARIGLVTGKGIAAVVKIHYNKTVLYSVVALVVVANTINIGADIGAMASAAQLLVPLPFAAITLFFTGTILLLEIFTNYKVYSRILKWLALALLSYPITVFLVHQPWLTVLKASIIPHIEFNFQFLFIITGVLGTTISPYMFFWEASQEIEDQAEKHLKKGAVVRPVNRRDISRMRIDNNVGMVISEITTWCIILVAATVLHGGGIKDVKTAADAAKALEPLVKSFPHAGYLAKLIFSIGIIGLGMLAIPVLSGSAAYAVAEALSWKASLNLKLNRARGFYGVIIVATLIGLLINFIGIDPVKALVYAAVLNGVAAVPLLFLVARIARNKDIMGTFRSGPLSNILLWVTFVAMGTAAIAMFFTF